MINDYFVEYIFNGETLLTKDYKSFKNIILEKIWNEDKINNFCYPKDESKQNKSENNPNNEKYKIATLILSITNGIFFVLTLVFIFLFIQNRKKTKILLNNSKNEPILSEIEKIK